MGGSQNFAGMVQDMAGSALEYALNFGSDIAAIEGVVVNVFIPAVGMLISMWGVWQLIHLNNPQYRAESGLTPKSVVIKCLIGPITIQLVSFMRSFSVSIFGGRGSELQGDMAESYISSAQSAGDPTQAGILVVMGFFVLVGWIAGIRAMVMFAQIGSPGQDGFSLFKGGLARLLAGTVLCSFQFFMDDIFASATGEAGQFSSGLNI